MVGMVRRSNVCEDETVNGVDEYIHLQRTSISVYFTSPAKQTFPTPLKAKHGSYREDDVAVVEQMAIDPLSPFTARGSM